MKIEIGKYYKTRCGDRVGPVELSFWEGLYTASGNLYDEFGRNGDEGAPDACIYNVPELDIVAEWEEPVGIEMKTWGDMTDAEKGALLLAHHEGKEIEYYGEIDGGWALIPNPNWYDNIPYRIKPVKSVTEVYMYFNAYVSDPTHKITFDTIDGEPDCSSIKMEKV